MSVAPIGRIEFERFSPQPAYPLREDEKHPERTRWEYKVTERSGINEMNALGLMGWELICLFGSVSVDCLYWKRRLP